MPMQAEVTPTLVYAQKGRAISVETVLGPDALLLESFDGEEEIAGGFRYTLGLLGKDPSVSAAQLIRTKASVKLTLSNGSERVINGMISRFAQGEQVEGLTVYEVELRPWFWFLSLTTDYCVFQKMSVPTIVKQVCKEHGFSDVSVKCIKPHPDQEYRVQYGETHLDFISRLMEEEGIFWFAEHDGGKCNLVLADDNSVAKHVVKLRMSTTGHATEGDDVLSSFAVRQEVRPTKFTANDYNFETPSRQLLADASGKSQGPAAEVFEFPGGYETTDDGGRIAHIRYQELVAEQVEAEGEGRSREVVVGAKVELSNHTSRTADGAYLVTSIRHSAQLGDFRSGGAPGMAYSSRFTAVPFATPYRPERTTPLPRAYGYESAVVVGPAGDEIFTDSFGRVKVQFFWDRRGKKDDKSSCWVRVSTVWAGKGWGVINTPRIGQEVLVAFLNGDPEDPIIVGRVYNAEQMPPYGLPANKTQSGIKTRSTLQGTPDNFNEIRFEDKKGSEQLFIHAEKNQDIEVEKDETHWVGHDRTKTVDNDETTHVKHDRTETVDNNETISVGGNRSETVGKDESIAVSGNRSETVSKDESVSIGKDRSHTISKNDTLDVSENRTISIGKDTTATIGGKRATSVGKDDSLDVGKNLTITVADSITIKAGDASISMKKNGDITIKGNNITLEGSGKINVKASSDLALKGSKVTAN
jgi:type VI secretion system secreted protein VgrG